MKETLTPWPGKVPGICLVLVEFRLELFPEPRRDSFALFPGLNSGGVCSSSPGDLIQLFLLDRPEYPLSLVLLRQRLINPWPTRPTAMAIKAATKVRPITRPATLSLSFCLSMKSSMMMAATLGLSVTLSRSGRRWISTASMKTWPQLFTFGRRFFLFIIGLR